MRACVIFNPTARGDKARHFRRHLEEFSDGIALKPTQAPGDGRRLATEAVRDGFDTLVAAGGDGTVNEVLNGIADAPSGFARARLAVLPLGTVNVFARELGLPLQLRPAWQAIMSAWPETRVFRNRLRFLRDIGEIPKGIRHDGPLPHTNLGLPSAGLFGFRTRASPGSRKRRFC